MTTLIALLAIIASLLSIIAVIMMTSLFYAFYANLVRAEFESSDVQAEAEAETTDFNNVFTFSPFRKNDQI